MTAIPNLVSYPATRSEFEIQADLFAELKKLCDVRGCVRSKCKIGEKRNNVWFECKNTPHNTSLNLKRGSRQDRRYSMFGVPVLRCGSEKQFDAILNLVDAAMDVWMAEKKMEGGSCLTHPVQSVAA
jgi:hypothetical protein